MLIPDLGGSEMTIALRLRKSVLFLIWVSLFSVVVVVVTSDREY